MSAFENCSFTVLELFVWLNRTVSSLTFIVMNGTSIQINLSELVYGIEKNRKFGKFPSIG